MYRYLLNIGLMQSATLGNGTELSAREALETVRNTVRMVFGGEAAVSAHAVHQSDTEPTLVVELRTLTPMPSRVTLLADALCVRLRQEAIAIAVMAGPEVHYGFLTGPLAHRWGAFNPDFFLMLDGSRPAAALEVAA